MKREADDDDEEVEKETDGLAGRTGPDVGERLPPARPRQCGGLQRDESLRHGVPDFLPGCHGAGGAG